MNGVMMNVAQQQIATPDMEMETLASLMHVLAATNHHQWASWQRFVLPPLKTQELGAIDALIEGELHEPLRELLTDQAIQLSAIARRFECLNGEGDFQRFYTRKHQQLMRWVLHARGNDAIHLEHWQDLADKPFSAMQPNQLVTSYREAGLDLELLADMAGFPLTDRYKNVEPLEGIQAYFLRLRHAIGSHHPYLLPDGRKQTVCAYCGESWTS